MDYILDILIQKNEIGKMKLSELFVEWGGENFSQAPPRYTNNSKIFLTEYEINEYYKKLLGEGYSLHTFCILHLEGTLFDLERAVNNKGDFFHNEIMLFLTELFELEKFIILLMREEEWIDEKYKIHNKNQLYNIIYNSLSWSNPKGVFITNF